MRRSHAVNKYNFSYNRLTSTNKVNNTRTNSAGITTTGSIGSASATFSAGTGTATASVRAARLDPLKGVAVGLVNDPLTIMASSGSPGTAALTIGLPESPLFLQASDDGDITSALYEFALNGQTLLSLEIGIDSSTTSLLNAEFTFFAFDAAGLGFGSMDQTTYLDTVLLPFLMFDPATHVLAGTSPILISNGPFLLPAGGSADFTWNFAGVAGDSQIPEPATWLLAGSCLAGLLAGSMRRYHLTENRPLA
jgi:hypothetical protein